MYAVLQSRTNKGFSAPPGSASRTVEKQVFCHNLQKNSKKAIGCHRLSRPKPGSRVWHNEQTAAAQRTNRIFSSSMPCFAKNTKKALTVRLGLPMIENMMIKTYTEGFNLVGLVAQRGFCAFSASAQKEASHG